MERDKKLFWAAFALVALLQLYVQFNKHEFFSHAWGDILMHIVWGAVIFLFLVIFLRWRPTDALLGVLAWQILWEHGEMIDDKMAGDTGIFVDNLFFDGIKDTAMDLLGGLVGWALWYPFRTHELFERRLLRLRVWVYLMGLTLMPMILIGSVWYLRTGVSPNHFAVIWLFVSIVLVTVYARFKQFPVPIERRKANKQPTPAKA